MFFKSLQLKLNPIESYQVLPASNESGLHAFSILINMEKINTNS